MFAASGEFNAEATERTQVRPKGGSSWSVLDLALGSSIDYSQLGVDLHVACMRGQFQVKGRSPFPLLVGGRCVMRVIVDKDLCRPDTLNTSSVRDFASKLFFIIFDCLAKIVLGCQCHKQASWEAYLDLSLLLGCARLRPLLSASCLEPN